MATVRLGRLLGPVGFSRTVAVKQLHPFLAKDPDFVAMMLDEARLAARIHHPNVVITLDVVAEKDELLVVMEYVHGESLARLAAAGPIPIGVAVGVVAGALHGLHAAHEAKSERGRPLGIVHRDVSPHNVIVGTDGVARVADFGVAKAVGRMQMTRTGQVKGKAAYMAPEQLSGQAVDRRADVYSAAIVLWEALTGARLFARENDVDTVRAAGTVTPPPPSRLRAGIEEELDAIVLRGLARRPQDRFDTARDMAIALEDAVPPPRAHEIGAWVEEVAGEPLRARAERVAEVERGTGILSARPKERSSRRAPLLIAGAVGAALAAGVVLIARARIAADASTRAAPPPPPSVATSEGPAPEPPPTGVSPMVDAPPTARAPQAHPPPTHVRTAPRGTASCDPPFTIDATGVKIPKRECLGGR
jgi:serine/threonine-protein kinase